MFKLSTTTNYITKHMATCQASNLFFNFVLIPVQNIKQIFFSLKQTSIKIIFHENAT